MANEYYLQHVMFIIGQGEGSIEWTSNGYRIKYDAVELGEPYEGIGLLQWSFSRSFDILREIYVALGNNFGGTTPPANVRDPIVNNQQWSSHKWYQYNDDTKWVRDFLNLDTAKAIATQKKMDETQAYITQINGQGVTDLRAAGFGADIGNQYGTGWGTVFGMARYNSSHNSLDSIFNASPMKYLTRRKNVYNYLKDANFDNPPPVTYSVEDIDSAGPQDTPPPITDEPEVIKEVEKELLQRRVYQSGGFYMNKFYKITPELDNTMIVSANFNLLDINLDDLIDTGNEYQEEQNENKNENANNEINNIGDVSVAIQNFVAKANSYPDYSVLYSMYGPRDMVTSGDCSCFVDLCFRAVGVNVGGATPEQYNTAKSLGKIVIEGGRSTIPTIVSQARAGDVLLMGKEASNTTYGYGGASHTGIIIANNTMRHQSSKYRATGDRYGPGNEDLNDYLNNWVSNYQNFCLYRLLD